MTSNQRGWKGFPYFFVDSHKSEGLSSGAEVRIEEGVSHPVEDGDEGRSLKFKKRKLVAQR